MRRTALALLLLVASGCDRPPGDQGLTDRIAAQVEAGAVVDLAALAPFVWDRLYVFPPYTTEGVAERHTGISWPESWPWSDVDRMDDRAFLVFLHEGEVVSAFDHPRRAGDFSAGLPDDGLVPEAARFVVRDRGDGIPALVPEATPGETGE